MPGRPIRRRLQQLRAESPQFGAEAVRGGDRGESPAQWVLPAVRDLRVQAGERGRVAVQDLRVDSGERGRVRRQAGSGAGGDSEGRRERRVLRRRLRIGVRDGPVRRGSQRRRLRELREGRHRQGEIGVRQRNLGADIPPDLLH